MCQSCVQLNFLCFSLIFIYLLWLTHDFLLWSSCGPEITQSPGLTGLTLAQQFSVKSDGVHPQTPVQPPGNTQGFGLEGTLKTISFQTPAMGRDLSWPIWDFLGSEGKLCSFCRHCLETPLNSCAVS